MNRSLVIFFINLCFIGLGFGQQSPSFADYSYNGVLINPSFAGYYQDIDIVLGHSQYVSDLPGRPRTFAANANIPLADRGMGISLGVLADRIGVINSNTVSAAYAYHIPIKKRERGGRWWNPNPERLSFGLSAGLMQRDERLLDLNMGNDPVFAQNVQERLAIFNAGILYNDDVFFLGLSAGNLFVGLPEGFSGTSLEPTYYFQGGGRFLASRHAQNLLIVPSLLVKYVDQAPVQLDLNLLLNFKNRASFGMGYRTTEAVNLMVGVTLGRSFNILYQYTLTNGDSPLGNSQGIMMRYRLGQGLVF